MNTVVEEIRSTRIERGLSQADVGRAAGISVDQLVRADDPLGSREVLAALVRGRAPALNGIVLLRVPGARPQRVHNGGKVVDAAGPSPPGFVENRVGRAFPGP